MTEAKLRSIYYFVGDRPVYKLPFGPKCHELFVILYSIHANLSDDIDDIFRSLYSFPDNYLYCSILFPEGKWLLQHIGEWVFLKNN
jgi:hypothetical protein